VEEKEIFLPPERFRRLVSSRPAVRRRQATELVDSLDVPFTAGMTAGLRYVGYFFRYLRSMEYPGRIIKAIVQIFPARDRLRTKAIERLKPERQAGKRFETYKYDGVFMFLTDRIFIIETDSLLHNAVTETILYPTHKHPMTLLYGEAFGISSGTARAPYMSPIVYEFLGTRVNLRQLIAQCGLYEEQNPTIDERIRRYVLSRQRA
jgi:hypothetical protein